MQNHYKLTSSSSLYSLCVYTTLLNKEPSLHSLNYEGQVGLFQLKFSNTTIVYEILDEWSHGHGHSPPK